MIVGVLLLVLALILAAVLMRSFALPQNIQMLVFIVIVVAGAIWLLRVGGVALP